MKKKNNIEEKTRKTDKKAKKGDKTTKKTTGERNWKT